MARPRSVITPLQPPAKSLRDDPYLTITKAQELAGISGRTLRRACDLGELKAARFCATTDGRPSQQSKWLIRTSLTEKPSARFAKHLRQFSNSSRGNRSVPILIHAKCPAGDTQPGSQFVD